MDVHDRIRKLLAERGWSEYRLAIESGLSQSTIANLFRRNTIPSIDTLSSICAGFGISLAQFFAENDLVSLSEEQQLLFSRWLTLTAKQKKAIFDLIEVMKQE